MRPVLTHLALHVRDLEASIAFYRAYCGMQLVHERVTDGRRVVWLAEPGREHEFIFVLVPGGRGKPQAATDYSHLGFAMESRAAVDAIAAQAREAGALVWEPRQEPRDKPLSIMRLSTLCTAGGGAPSLPCPAPITDRDIG